MKESFEEKFQQFYFFIKKVKKPVIVVHPKPDADCFGAGFALGNFLKKTLNLEKVDIYCEDQPGISLMELFPVKHLINKLDFLDFDSLFFVDMADNKYKSNLKKELDDLGIRCFYFNIDHHQNAQFNQATVDLTDSSASATCEIMHRFFQTIDYDFDTETAQFLLNGIFADTGGFRHNNTTPKVLEISSQLLKKGASISKVNRALFLNKKLKTLKLWGVAIDRARVNRKTGMVVSFITREDMERYEANSEDISGIVEVLNTISDAKFSLLLTEQKVNQIRASLRSEEYKEVDVSKIARMFQGGGHKLASGFKLKGSLKKRGDDWVIE